MIRERLEHIFREVFADDHLKLKDDLSPSNYDAWDSVNMVQVVMSVEPEFGVRLSMDEVAAITNAKSLLDILSVKTGLPVD